MKPGGSILLLKLTKLTNLTKQTYEKKPNANLLQISPFAKFFKLTNCKRIEKLC